MLFQITTIYLLSWLKSQKHLKWLNIVSKIILEVLIKTQNSQNYEIVKGHNSFIISNRVKIIRLKLDLKWIRHALVLIYSENFVEQHSEEQEPFHNNSIIFQNKTIHHNDISLFTNKPFCLSSSDALLKFSYDYVGQHELYGREITQDVSSSERNYTSWYLVKFLVTSFWGLSYRNCIKKMM
jgi:hypothetical protein